MHIPLSDSRNRGLFFCRRLILSPRRHRRRRDSPASRNLISGRRKKSSSPHTQPLRDDARGISLGFPRRDTSRASQYAFFIAVPVPPPRIPLSRPINYVPPCPPCRLHDSLTRRVNAKTSARLFIISLDSLAALTLELESSSWQVRSKQFINYDNEIVTKKQTESIIELNANYNAKSYYKSYRIGNYTLDISAQHVSTIVKERFSFWYVYIPVVSLARKHIL